MATCGPSSHGVATAGPGGMRAEAKQRFRQTRPSSCVYCGTWIKCDMYRHVAKFHLDQCPGAQCGRARHRIVWIMLGGGGRMMSIGSLSQPASSSSFPRGQFVVRCGRIP